MLLPASPTLRSQKYGKIDPTEMGPDARRWSGKKIGREHQIAAKVAAAPLPAAGARKQAAFGCNRVVGRPEVGRPALLQFEAHVPFCIRSCSHRTRLSADHTFPRAAVQENWRQGWPNTNQLTLVQI